MPMRVGEMMVIVRAQDFASRTLRRVSGEFAGMSRQQAIAQKRSQLVLRQMQTADRIRATMDRGRGLDVLRRQIEAQETLSRLQSQTRLRDATGAFIPKGPAIEAAVRGLDDMNRQVQMLPPNLQRLGLQLSQYPNAAAMLDSAVVGNTRKLRQLGIEAGMSTREMAAFNQMVKQLPLQNLDRMAHALSGMGRTMQLFGAVGTVAFGMAADKAAKFDTQMSLAATQARDLAGDGANVALRLDQLSNGFDRNGQEIGGVLDLMSQYPAKADQMSAATYDIFSSMDLEEKGIIDVAKGLGLLEKANKVAVAGGVDLDEATSAMITTFNNFGFTAEEQAENLDTMFDIVRFGRMRLSDFNIMMNKIAPAAADAGNKLEDVGGAMAYLTTVMPSQRMVATGISRLLEALRHPDVVKGLKMFGVEAKTASGKLRPLDDIMRDLASTFPELGTGQKSAAEFFREISAAGRGGGRGQIFTQEGRRSLSLIMTHMEDYLDAQNRIEKNTGEFTAAHDAQMQSLGVQWEIFKNRLSAVAIAVGTDAIPVFTELGELLQQMLDAWNSMDPGMQEAIVRFGVWAAVGTLLGGVLLAVVGSMIAFEAMLRRIGLRGGGALSLLTNLRLVLSRIAAFAAVSIILKVAWGGDPTAKDFLMGAVLGAVAGGSRAGLPGAIAGAIIVPVVMQMMNRGPNLLDQAADDFIKKNRSGGASARAWAQYIARNFRQGITKGLMDLEEFRDFNKQMKSVNARERGMTQGIHNQSNAHKAAAASTDKHVDALGNYYKALQKARKENSRINDEIAEWNNRLKQATKQAGIDAVNNLQNMYMRMEQVNRDAMGQLFEGPWLTSTTFDLAKEWGIMPRIDDMIKDLTMQNSRFVKWRSSLDKLLKRGVPRGLLDELRQMGPEKGQGFVDAMLQADPAKMNTLISRWKMRNKQIQSATKMDFKDEIDRFRKAGVDMGDAIKEGFESAAVGKWFDNWVQVQFPSVISAAVNKAIAEWREGNPIPTAPPLPPLPKLPPGLSAALGVTTGLQVGRAGGIDNSKNITVEVNMPPGSNPDSGAARDRGRAIGFEVANRLRGTS